MSEQVGALTWISGPVVHVRTTGRLAILEQVWVGEARLAGEVIALDHDKATVQVYEETTGLRPGEPLFGSGHLLSLTLGPGLLGGIFDGIQRPLTAMRDVQGLYVQRGLHLAPLPDRKWHFQPRAQVQSAISGGELLGVIQETTLIEHRILVPSSLKGILVDLASEGDFGLQDKVGVIVDAAGTEHALTLTQQWPVRQPRPVTARLEPSVPLITGQRILDTFFPVAKGGVAAIPGPFGAGKTVTQHSLAKWSDAQIIVYVGCGERGNEMAQVLEDFPKLTDPWSGRPLMERTILVANTSNMPVAAREASIYTGITLAEYYRDQGYDVALMADSTSRWAEALREISGRLEEMPAEEGFPAYLPSRLAAFYERAGRVRTLGGQSGSITVIGAVSPPGGDFSEPVTQHTQRFTRCFWALDRTLASARHFPAVNWLTSYSFYTDAVAGWWVHEVDPNWRDLGRKAMGLLENEERLQEIVRLVGADALPDRQRWVLEAARILKQGFLQQNALHEIDAYTVPAKQFQLLQLFVEIYEQGSDLIAMGAPVVRLTETLDITRLIRLKEDVPNSNLQMLADVRAEVIEQLQKLAVQQHERRARVSQPREATGIRDFLGADRIEGPLLVIETLGDAAFGEVVEVTTESGAMSLGRVLEAGERVALVELWGESSGLSPSEVKVRFFGHGYQTPVTHEMLGRAFDGLGRPRDGLPIPLAEHIVDVNGSPLNPVMRSYPHDYLETGISAIDGMNTLVRGQKLPIFSGAGLPHNELAAQIARQAHTADQDASFATLFVALGAPHDTADFFQNSFAESGALAQAALFLNLADDPPVERIITPRIALSLAEFLAYEHDYHVLVIMTDMTNYAEALRELASRRSEVPSRKGYPGYLYSDLASLYERCGRVEGRLGSITQMPILTMPNDDITHPVPDLTGYITEGQIVLSRELHREGIYPPIDVLPSLSRLMKDGIGAGHTRDDHPHLANQLYASFAQVQQVRSLSAIIGEEALSSIDRAYLAFGKAFETQFVAQRMEGGRSIAETLDLGWAVLAHLPEQELIRVTAEEVRAYFHGKLDRPDDKTNAGAANTQ